MITIKGNLILKENTTYDDNLTVEGNIICEGGLWDINAGDINAGDINAGNINFYAVCFAYNNIKCKSINGRRNPHKEPFVLDGKIKKIIDKKLEEDLQDD